MTNQDVIEAIKNNDKLKDYNADVQKRIDKFKGDILSGVQKSMSGCKPDIIEVPDLFFGDTVKNPDGTHSAADGSGHSILPNPTNAITVNDTVIAPEPYNEAFKQSAVSSYESKGLKSEFIDTFDCAHRKEGNLHCATNTIHVCRPAGAKK